MQNSSEFILVNTDVIQLSQSLKAESQNHCNKEQSVCHLSASIASVDVNKVPERFKLGMSDWSDSESENENNDNFQPPKSSM